MYIAYPETIIKLMQIWWENKCASFRCALTPVENWLLRFWHSSPKEASGDRRPK